MTNVLLNELNAFRATENLAPFADWRKARHMPMLEAYRAAMVQDAAAEADEMEGDEPDALIVLPNGETVRESEIEEYEGTDTHGEEAPVDVAPAAHEANAVAVEKLPAYKVLARQSGATSAIEKPVEFVHSFLTANPDMKRKAAVAALVEAGVNYSTARTQYQKWFTANKK